MRLPHGALLVIFNGARRRSRLGMASYSNGASEARRN
jgi:hypothetical protein